MKKHKRGCITVISVIMLFVMILGTLNTYAFTNKKDIDIKAEAPGNIGRSMSLNDDYSVEISISHTEYEPVEFIIDYSISNYGDDSGKLSLYTALYDFGGKLYTFSLTPLNIAKGSDITDTVSMMIPMELDPGKVLFKVFLWNAETMAPVIPALERTYSAVFKGDDDVHLTYGMFADSQEVGEQYLLGLNVDRLMRPFYNQAGRSSEAKAAAYPDWESTAIAGHSMGHYLTATAMMYRQTGNLELKERLDYAVSELAKIQDAQGFIGGGFTRMQMEAYFDNPTKYTVSEPANMGAPGLSWAPWYNLHKTYQGLNDAYALTGNELALETAVKFADWAVLQSDKITDVQFQNMLRCEYGGMNESLAELYLLTKDAGYPNADNYLTLAKRFCQDSLFTPLSNGMDNLNGMHANTQIPKIVGAALIYKITGEEYYKKVSEFFWDTVAHNRSYITGGNSIAEYFRDNEELSAQTTETCNTYNMLKLTEYIYSWNQDSKYADYYENALYNHILGSQDPQTGGKSYFIPFIQGHFRYYSKQEGNFWCCMGTGFENPARYSRFIYHNNGRDLYVNLFIPSTLLSSETGLALVQENDYPIEDTTKLRITKGAKNVNIKLRVPNWVAGPVEVTVNGEVAAEQQEAGYITLSGNWKRGDVIEARFPMDLKLYTSRYNAQSVAVLYGPVVLAGDFGRVDMTGIPENNVVTGDHSQWNNFSRIDVLPLVYNSRDPKDWIRRVDNESLTFETLPIGMLGGSIRTLRPFFDIPYNRYAVYWNLLTEEEFTNGEGGISYEDRLAAVSIDDILVGQNQPEIDHNMVVVGDSRNGFFETADSWWRDVVGIGSVSFDMKVQPNGENYLVQRYWGADGNYSSDGTNYTRTFHIYIDGTLLKTQTLTGNGGNQLLDVFDRIPASFTQGKDKVAVKFESAAMNTVVGGVFRIRITSEIVNE